MAILTVRYYAGDVELVDGSSIVVREVNKQGEVVSSTPATLSTDATPVHAEGELIVTYAHGGAVPMRALAHRANVDLVVVA